MKTQIEMCEDKMWDCSLTNISEMCFFFKIDMFLQNISLSASAFF